MCGDTLPPGGRRRTHTEGRFLCQARSGSREPRALDRTQVDWLAATAQRIQERIETVVEGKGEVVRLALTVLLAEGHLLIEDVPGVGKTLLAKALARALDCTVRRIQFTPDLLPSDVTGVTVYDQHRGEFEFKPGAGLRQRGARRRDQPRLAEDPVRAARVHGRAPGHGRRHDLPARGAVPGDRHPEPGRDGGHLPAARGPARPVHGAGGHGLPGPRRRARMLEGHAAANPRRRPAAGGRHRGRGQADRHGPRGLRLRRGQAVRRSTWSRATREHPDLRLGASPRASLHLRAGGQGARRARAAAASCCPTTSSTWRSRCSRTG